MTSNPVDLHRAFASFDTEWSPHIVTRVNDFDVRIVKIRGEFVWHRHVDTDEFFHVISGDVDIALRDDDGRERVVNLTEGSAFTVPRGTEHKPSSISGAHVLLFEPSDTVNTGDEHDDIPSHISSTTGRVMSAG